MIDWTKKTWTASGRNVLNENGDSEVKAFSVELARAIAALPELIVAARDAFGVLTEPGMMDVDEWKAWQHRTVAALHDVLAKIDGEAEHGD